MPKEERPEIKIEDGESNTLHATWSRSWKHLILSVHPRGRWHEGGQVELDPQQVERLRAFIEETPPR